MKYNAPYGSADPNAPYIDRNTPGAQSGSRVPAAAVEQPQREIMAVISAAGITASAEDLTQLLQAIQALISAATGGGDTSNFVLMTAARARLPIYPEALTSDGIIPIVSPGVGVARLPAGYNFLHRGIYTVTTVQTDFLTAASKTYHLRWTPGAGFSLKDLADSGYNPSSLAENNQTFDSKYDDMLVARIVTNASNVLTIVNLVNRDRLFDALMTSKTVTRATSSTTGGAWLCPMDAVSINWARTPKYCASFSRVGLDGALSAIPEEPRAVLSGSLSDGTGTANASADRYSLNAVAVIDTNTASVSRTFEVQMSASWQA